MQYIYNIYIYLYIYMYIYLYIYISIYLRKLLQNSYILSNSFRAFSFSIALFTLYIHDFYKNEMHVTVFVDCTR